MPNKIYLMMVLVIIAVAGLVVTAPTRVQSAVYHERIAHDDDDAQQNDAVMHLDDPMLDVGDIDEEMALRFINVTVPKGSIINNAYVEFTCYQDRDKSPDVDISGEDVGDALGFIVENNHIEDRIAADGTSATVAWYDVPAWTENNTYRTPQLKTIIREIIDNSGWSSGNAMIIFLVGTSHDNQAYSHDSSPSQAPLLHIDYTPPGSD